MAKIEIISTMNSTQYKRGVKDMKDQNSKFGKSLGGVKSKISGAFKAAAVLAFVAAVSKGVAMIVNFGSKLTDLAAQSDISVEKLQVYKKAVIDAGGDISQLTNALVQLKAKQGDTLSGNKEYADSFKLLGITTQDLAEMNTEQLFEKIAKSVTESGNAAKQYNAALEILGKRGGGKLIEAINAIGSATDGANAGLKTLSNENAQVLDKAADDWAQFIERIKTSAATGLATIIKGLFGGVDDRLDAQEAQKALAAQARLQQGADLKAEQAAEKKKKLEEKITEEKKKQAVIDNQKAATAQRLKDIEKSVKLERDTDQFRRVGIMAGASVSQELQVARRALDIQRRQEDLLAKIEENTQDDGGLAA